MKETTQEQQGHNGDSNEVVLFPLADTVTARRSLDYALDAVAGGTLHVVVALGGVSETPEGQSEREQASALLRKAKAWKNETDTMGTVTMETAVLGEDAYLYGPRDYVSALESYAEDHAVTRIILDPAYRIDDMGPMVDSFDAVVQSSDLSVEIAPVSRPTERQGMASGFSPIRVGTLFVISLAFYLILGDPLYWFDWITGVAVAGIVAIMLSNVTFANAPDYPGSISRTIRFAMYVPYLIVEIIKANIAIAVVILRPSLPIDPQMTEVNVRVGNGLPLLAMANSITLTPGTLTVRANNQRLIIHTLVPSARSDLFGGRLERAVRFVFYGRGHAAIASPEERGDAKVIEGGDSQ